jgi:hypothetical protein
MTRSAKMQIPTFYFSSRPSNQAQVRYHNITHRKLFKHLAKFQGISSIPLSKFIL